MAKKRSGKKAIKAIEKAGKKAGRKGVTKTVAEKALEKRNGEGRKEREAIAERTGVIGILLRRIGKHGLRSVTRAVRTNPEDTQ